MRKDGYNNPFSVAPTEESRKVIDKAVKEFGITRNALCNQLIEAGAKVLEKNMAKEPRKAPIARVRGLLGLKN